MKKIFTTEGVRGPLKFRRFQEALIDANGVPIEFSRSSETPFDAIIAAARLGPLRAMHGTDRDLVLNITPANVRRHDNSGELELCLTIRGTAKIAQDDRQVILGAGDMTILSWQQRRIETSGDYEFLRFWFPRQQIEAVLGTARVFSGLLIPRTLGSAPLVRTFLTELIRVYGSLDPFTGARMSAIGLDLVLASIAECLARDPPKSVQAQLTVQRAKAYVEQNLSDPTLDPPQLAAAMGVSLRRLQVLFQERGRNISDWIWERRLERAAHNLRDPGRAHLQLGALAHSCGFVNQAHFSHRFRDRFGCTPRDYRRTHRADAGM